MKIQYVEKKFQGRSLELIKACNAIIADYEREGYTLTLRQLYYRLVAAAIIPNTEQSYDRVGSIINDARLNGDVSWDAIEDRTRNLSSLSCWDNPAHIINSAAKSYRIDKWEGQHFRPEVWVEKEALAGIVARTVERNSVDYLACRGYMSQSEMFVAAQRFIRYYKAGQVPIVIHLGDHDPSGIDMTRDVLDRLELFISYHLGRKIEVRRIALNMDQIEHYNPPPNPAKLTDSRFSSYMARFGAQSWELDALEPSVLDTLIETTILQYRDNDLWGAAVAREQEGRATLEATARSMN